jgi:hypothetical protein
MTVPCESRNAACQCIKISDISEHGHGQAKNRGAANMRHDGTPKPKVDSESKPTEELENLNPAEAVTVTRTRRSVVDLGVFPMRGFRYNKCYVYRYFGN